MNERAHEITSDDVPSSPRHVLLVEDDAYVSLALRLRLEADGHRVSRAADVTHAVDGVLDDRPDVVVLDVNLPDGNGLALAARMRRLRATIDLPLVIVTASRDPDYRERAARLGVAFLEKPFAARALLEAIERETLGPGRTIAGEAAPGGRTKGVPPAADRSVA